MSRQCDEIDYLDTQYQSLQSDKLELQDEITNLTLKLHDRSQKFIAIEKEVCKVKNQYQHKESQLLKEKEDYIIQRDSMIEELESKIEV